MLFRYLAQMRSILYVAPVVLLAITCHEYAHGWMSDRLGDPTPRAAGRMSLNPLRHLDIFGTLCLLIFHIGWAKPVPIDPRYYRDRKKGIILVSLAGPATNLLLAFLSLLLQGVLIKFGSPQSTVIVHGVLLAYYSAIVNIGLALFNLIPLPPLDGSNIAGELSGKIAHIYYRWRPYWRLVLAVLVLTGILGEPLGALNGKVYSVFWSIVKNLLSIRFPVSISGTLL